MFVLTLFVLIGYGIDVARGECGGGNVFCLTIKSQPSCAGGGCEWDSELNLCEDGSGPTRKCNSYETKDECEGVKCLWTGVQPTPPPTPASDDFVGTTRRSTASTNQDSSSEANDWAIWTWIYYPVIFGGACLYYFGVACVKKVKERRSRSRRYRSRFRSQAAVRNTYSSAPAIVAVPTVNNWDKSKDFKFEEPNETAIALIEWLKKCAYTNNIFMEDASKLESENILEPFTKSAKEGEQKLKAKPRYLSHIHSVAQALLRFYELREPTLISVKQLADSNEKCKSVTLAKRGALIEQVKNEEGCLLLHIDPAMSTMVAEDRNELRELLRLLHMVDVQSNMPASTIGRKFVHSMKRGDDALHVQQVLAANAAFAYRIKNYMYLDGADFVDLKKGATPTNIADAPGVTVNGDAMKADADKADDDLSLSLSLSSTDASSSDSDDDDLPGPPSRVDYVPAKAEASNELESSKPEESSKELESSKPEESSKEEEEEAAAAVKPGAKTDDKESTNADESSKELESSKPDDSYSYSYSSDNDNKV